MKKLFILSICLLLTSCFEITEKIKHNSNQTGDYSLVIDFSNSWLKTKSAILLEEVDGVSIPNEEDIKSKLAQFRADASKIKGTSKISTSYDFNTYVFKINFSLKSESFKTSELLLYPNPATDWVFLKDNENSMANEFVIISDFTGKTLLSGVLNEDAGISVETLPNGLYFIKTKFGVYKLMIER